AGENVPRDLVAHHHRHIARLAISAAVQRGEAALALDHVIEGGAVGGRGIWSVATRRGVDDARVDGGDLRVIDAEPRRRARPHVAAEVGPGRSLSSGRPKARPVGRDGSLVITSRPTLGKIRGSRMIAPPDPEDLALVKKWFRRLSEQVQAVDFAGAHPLFAED